jgi:hypothetical protein
MEEAGQRIRLASLGQTIAGRTIHAPGNLEGGGTPPSASMGGACGLELRWLTP